MEANTTIICQYRKQVVEQTPILNKSIRKQFPPSSRTFPSIRRDQFKVVPPEADIVKSSRIQRIPAQPEGMGPAHNAPSEICPIYEETTASTSSQKSDSQIQRRFIKKYGSARP